MTKKAILLVALVGSLHAAGTAFALTGALGDADRIALREGYSQYEGKIDLRDATGAVTLNVAVCPIDTVMLAPAP